MSTNNSKSQRTPTSRRSASIVSGARPPSGGSSATRILIGVVVAAAIVLVGIVIAHRSTAGNSANSAVPSSASADGSIRFGPEHAKVTVKAVEDFQCPHCQAFEAESGSTLDALAVDGVGVEYQPIAILDQSSSTGYSTRSASAAYCVADADRTKWGAWHTAVFKEQPPEGGEGLSDDTLVQIAQSVGVTGGDVAQCITSHRFADFVTTTTQKLLAGGIQHTPTVTVNGQEVATPTPDAIRTAVAAAK